MASDDIIALQEELAEARAELEQLQAAVADREARAAHLESQRAELKEQLEQARREIEAREREQAEQRERIEGLEAAIRRSARRYRELALEQAPELPAELVAGDTVEEVDAAIQRARETVSKVRGHLEAQAQAGRVPMGAPARSEPDLSALSAEEKIKLGLRTQR